MRLTQTEKNLIKRRGRYLEKHMERYSAGLTRQAPGWDFKGTDQRVARRLRDKHKIFNEFGELTNTGWREYRNLAQHPEVEQYLTASRAIEQARRLTKKRGISEADQRRILRQGIRRDR